MNQDHNARNRASRERLATVGRRLGERNVALSDGWTASALFAHLAFWDRFAAARLRRYLRDHQPPDFGSDALTDFINEAARPQWLALGSQAAAGDAIAAAEATDRAIGSLSPADVEALRSLNRPRVLDRSAHRDEHLTEIERALG